MIDRDDEISRRYRALPPEGPPPALDAAILAASRRAVDARPSGVRRWAGPVSIAAVLVLGIGVSLRMQLEQPGVELADPSREGRAPAASPPPKAEAEAPRAAGAAPPATPAPPPKPAKPEAPPPRKAIVAETQPLAKEAVRAAPSASVPAPAPEPPAAPPSSPPAQAPAQAPSAASAPAPVAPPAPVPQAAPLARMQDRAVANEAAGAAPQRPKLQAQSVDRGRMEERAALPDTPERELERIAKLRDEGRHDEADAALKAFRARYPELRIPDATWDRVKPRDR